jgi:hypothetical protein
VTFRFPEETCVYAMNHFPCRNGGELRSIDQSVRGFGSIRDAGRDRRSGTARIGDSYSWVKLSSFSSHGGELIFYHGVSDPWCSAKDTIDYYSA